MAIGVRNWLKVRFIAGFFVTVPAFLTAWLLWIFWSRIDDVFAPMYQRILGRDLPGLGFLTAVAIILIMGTIARNVVGRRVLAWGDMLLLRVPIYRRLYPSVKMLIDSFSPERRSAFKAVVLVQHPREGAYAFGFVTSDVLLDALDGRQTPRHTGRDRRGDQDEPGHTAGRRDAHRHHCAEGVSGDADRNTGAHPCPQLIDRGPGVGDFGKSPTVSSGRPADAPKIE